MLKAVPFWVCLAVAVVIAVFVSRTPAPVPANAHDSEFSAMRAFKDVEAVAARPHPTGSPDHARVRDYLLGRMRALGLEVSTQDGIAWESADDPDDGKYMSGANLVNLIGVMPGRDRTKPALVVMSHYDSVPSSPGAADDTVGVAAALEIARALQAPDFGPGAGSVPVTTATQKRPARDVIFLITDGEEIGLLGAKAFFADHPMSKRVGAVVNMESRGGAGRVYMFQTSAQNGELVRLFGRTAVNPTSTSLATFLYNSMPNDTDFTVSKAAGKIGLNYAFIGSQFDYHAATSTPANLDKGSLQHMGSQVLAATRALSQAETLPGPAADAIYADVLGGPVIAYPEAVGWLLLLLAAGLIGAALWRARRVQPWSDLDMARGFGAALYMTLLCAAAFVAVRGVTGVPRGFADGRPLLARFAEFEAALAFAALAVFCATLWALRRGGAWIPMTAAALIVGLLTLLGGVQPIPLGLAAVAAALGAVVFRGPISGWAAWTGVLALGVLLGAGLQMAAPQTALIAHWPLLAAGIIAVTAAYAAGARLDHPITLGVAAVLAALVSAQLLYTVHPVLLGVGALLPAAPAIFLPMLALCLVPLLWAGAGRMLVLAAGAAVILALGLALFIRFSDVSDPRRPHITQAVFVADAETGRAWRATSLRRPDAWTRGVLRADGGRIEERPVPVVTRWGHLAPATPIPVAKPPLTVTRDAAGRVSIKLGPVAGARELRLRLTTSATVLTPRINGKFAPGLTHMEKGVTLVWAAPSQGLTIDFLSRSGGAADLRYAVITDAWPAQAKPLPARPADAMPWGATDATAVVGDRHVAW